MREAVDFAEFAKLHPEVQVLGINVADGRGDAREFEEEFGWTFPSVFDPDRSLAAQLGASYQPFYALLDAEGNLVARSLQSGQKGWGRLLESLEVS
ncbi:MAG: TlpA family protein disulfide reductase [Gaiellaceae bacterium]